MAYDPLAMQQQQTQVKINLLSLLYRVTIQVLPNLKLPSKKVCALVHAPHIKMDSLFWFQREVGNNVNGHPVYISNSKNSCNKLSFSLKIHRLLQVDHLGCYLVFVNIKAKVAFQYMLPILRCIFCFDVNNT